MGHTIKILCFIALLASTTGCSQSKYPYNYSGNQPISKKHILKVSKQQLGVEYKYGGQSPDKGFDCSGLVYYSYQQAGITLPRTTYGQLKRSRPIAKKNLSPGDLVFFRIYRSRVSHVGIYLGNRRFIHAPSTGKAVSIARLDSPYWQKRFIRAGRISGMSLNRKTRY